MIDWWAIAVGWRQQLGGLEHGEVGLRITAFAKEAGLAPGTVRRCVAALAFAERLKKEALVGKASQLAGLPLKSMGSLHRISRYGSAELEPLLRQILGRNPPTEPEILAFERTIRARSDGDAGREGNAHAFRLRSLPFRLSALAAFERAAVAEGARSVRPTWAGWFAPFAVDAVRMDAAPAAYTGIRLLAATASTTVRPRVAEAFLFGLAAARVFQAFVILAQDQSDADDVANRIQLIGACGVGAWWFDQGSGTLVSRQEPARTQPPDLAAQYADEFARCFPKAPSTEPGSTT